MRTRLALKRPTLRVIPRVPLSSRIARTLIESRGRRCEVLMLQLQRYRKRSDRWASPRLPLVLLFFFFTKTGGQGSLFFAVHEKSRVTMCAYSCLCRYVSECMDPFCVRRVGWVTRHREMQRAALESCCCLLVIMPAEWMRAKRRGRILIIDASVLLWLQMTIV